MHRRIFLPLLLLGKGEKDRYHTFHMRTSIPQPVIDTLAALEKAGFEAYIVGGCVRDLLLDKPPKDWDITTDARPEAILETFPESFYENTFGTVGVKVPPFLPGKSDTREHDIIEVTTYRSESGYTDHRRPDSVTFVSTLEEDLARRDFTMNAIAGKITGLEKNDQENSSRTVSSAECDISFIDPFHGREDIRAKKIRAVGVATERFAEDALRMMRGVRLLSELSQIPKGKAKADIPWTIEEATLAAIHAEAKTLAQVSQERIRDEFSRIILSDHAAEGVELLRSTGLLTSIIPELEEGVGMSQNLHHIYTVWEHNVRALATCPSRKLDVRLAALLHDVGKPRTKRGEGYRATFYNHDHVGGRMTRVILTRLRYPKQVVDKASLLVDQHLFYYNVGEVTEASVRRLIRRVGLENMDDLMAVRIGDRLGSGVPKAKPYKLRHLEYMIEKVSKDPLSVGMLAIKGADLMGELGMTPGPMIGAILDVLLAEVIEEPRNNTKPVLLERAAILARQDLKILRKQAQEKIHNERAAEDAKIKKGHWVE